MLSKQVEIRGSIRNSIRYRIQSPELTKESRSIDRAENLTKLKGVSTQKSSWIPKFTNQESRHKVGLKSRRLRTRITPKPVRIIYWEISSSSTGSTRNQDQFVFVFVETDRPGFFKVNSFKSDNKVMKFLLISYRKSDIWKTRLIGKIITDQVQVQVQVFGITK
jgi:hypothetical protein